MKYPADLVISAKLEVGVKPHVLMEPMQIAKKLIYANSVLQGFTVWPIRKTVLES